MIIFNYLLLLSIYSLLHPDRPLITFNYLLIFSIYFLLLSIYSLQRLIHPIPMTIKKLVLLLLLVCGLAVAPAQADATAPAAPSFQAAPCMFKIPFAGYAAPETLGFECGYVTAPLRHQNPAGPTIRLPVAILRATGPHPRPDPLFLAQGGPGGDAFSAFALTALGSAIRSERDIVIFNQRGTLYAEPSLVCTETLNNLDATLTLPPVEATARTNQAYAGCRKRLADQGIDLAAFNSLENAADVDAIRQALGYKTINFYGVSYGTLLGLHLMRDYPANLRAVILDSVVPTHINYLLRVPNVTERIFDKMLAACAASESCRSQYPELETRFLALIKRLNTRPVTIPVTDPDTGQTVPVYVDGKTFMNMLFQVFYLPQMYAVFPRLIAGMETGDYSFWQNLWPVLAFDRTFSEGMFYTVMCAEDSDFSLTDVSLAGLRPEIAAYARSDLQDVLTACQIWAVPRLPATVDEPVASNVPTLLLAGEFDPITPPEFAAAAAQYLPNGHLLVDPTSSHGVAFNDNCVDELLQDFLDTPTISPNAGCVQENTPTGFVPPTALVVPLLAKLNSLEASALAEVGAAGLVLAGTLSAWLVWPLAWGIRLIRKKPAATTGRWVNRAGKITLLLFGGLAIIFVGGLTAFAVSAFNSTPLLLLSAISGQSYPLFFIPYGLALLALLAVALAGLIWIKGAGSIWSRLYYTGVTICAALYVAMLAATGMLAVLAG